MLAVVALTPAVTGTVAVAAVVGTEAAVAPAVVTGGTEGAALDELLSVGKPIEASVAFDEELSIVGGTIGAVTGAFILTLEGNVRPGCEESSVFVMGDAELE